CVDAMKNLMRHLPSAPGRQLLRAYHGAGRGAWGDHLLAAVTVLARPTCATMWSPLACARAGHSSRPKANGSARVHPPLGSARSEHEEGESENGRSSLQIPSFCVDAPCLGKPLDRRALLALVRSHCDQA